MAFELKDIIAVGLGAYGALLSTFNFWQAKAKDRRQILIKQSTSFYTYVGGAMGPAMATFEIINQGHRPVVVDAPTIKLPSGEHLVFIGADGMKDFPKRLEDGNSASIRIPYTEIADSLKRNGYSKTVVLIPTCKDSIGNKFEGDKWSFDVDRGWTAT